MSIAKEKPQITTLCGLEPDQEKADFSYQGLGIGDAILLAFDLRRNHVLVKLECAAVSPRARLAFAA